MQQSAAEQTKSPEAFRTISEVADDLDVPQHVLRFWESRFSQIKPVKRAGARRYYRPEDVDLIRGIRALLYTEGFTIKGAQKILRDKGVRHVAELGRGEVAPKSEPRRRASAGRPKKDETYRELRAVDFSEEPLPQELESAWDAGEAGPAAPPTVRVKTKSQQPTLFADPPASARENQTAPQSAKAPAEVPEQWVSDNDAASLSPAKRAKLESLLEDLLSLKEKLRAARGMSV